MPDEIFAHPRLAAIYDAFDDDRSDLDAYESLIDELGATSVLDIGCGTGVLAIRLAGRGLEIIGLDPAAASLAVARAKPGGDRVRWIEGTATDLPDLQVDLAIMTGNVAQVFVGDEEWTAVLRAAAEAIRPGGHLVFEIRDPAARAWEGWNRATTERRLDLPDIGAITTWTDGVAVDLPLVRFRHHFEFGADGTTLTSRSTLRFRSKSQVHADVVAAGFEVREVRDAPDRPGLEFVFVARRTGQSVRSDRS